MTEASPKLLALAEQIKLLLPLATRKGEAAVYRPAVKTIVKLTRQLAREWEACNWRADLKASAETPYRYTPETPRTGRTWMPGWRG